MSRGSLETRLDAMLDGLSARKDLHSVVAVVESGDGSFRWSGARGSVSRDGRAMAPDIPWFAASITKLFIAAVVMRLVEEEELALGDRLVEEGDLSFSLAEVADRVREELRPHFPPQPLDGSRIRLRYSDTNYQLLIGIVEARRDAAFAHVLEEQVLEPLGLAHTWLAGMPRGESPEPEVAALYAGPDVVRFPLFFRSICDLNSTCADLLRFLRAGVEGRLFRHPSTWSRMATRRGRFPFPGDRAALRQPGWPIEYGLGVMRFRLPRPFTPFRPVPEVVGHTGSTGTWLFHAPEPDLYLVGAVSQITAGAVPFRVVPRMLKVLGAAHSARSARSAQNRPATPSPKSAVLPAQGSIARSRSSP